MFAPHYANILKTRRYVGSWHETDMPTLLRNVCFSNRPFGVKRFQTIHHHSVDVARGLVLLFGIDPSWDSRTGGTIFRAALPSIERQVQADMRTHLIHRPARDIFHRSVELEFSPIGFDPERFSCCCRGLLPGPPELGTINPDAVHDDG